MSYQIIWSPQANYSYQQILKYLQNRWTEREINNFIERTEEVLFFISQNPLYTATQNTIIPTNL